jgi:hypothetical protein
MQFNPMYFFIPGYDYAGLARTVTTVLLFDRVILPGSCWHAFSQRKYCP